MRLDGEHLDIHGQDVSVFDFVLRIASRNRDRFAPEPQAHRIPCGSHVGKEKSHADLNGLRLPGRLHVELHDEITVRLETPRHAIRRGARLLSRRPSEHVPGGIVGIGNHATDISRFRIRGVEATRRSRAIDADVGVVDGARIPWMKFNRFDVSRDG
jgi:hypothetical protein